MKHIKNLSWVFFANVFASFSKWLIVILIAKTLSVEDVGIYSLAFALGAPITLFANMKLRSLYITSEDDNLNDYIFARNILSALALIVLIVIGVYFYPAYSIIIILVGITKILDLQSDLYYALPHKKSDLNIIGKMIIGKQISLLTVFAVVLFLTRNLQLALLLQAVIQVVYLMIVERIYILNKYKISITKLTFKGIKNILILGIPLGFVQMVVSLNTNYPRYVLEYFESPEVLGYFSAIMYIVIVVNLFMNSISQVFLPKLSSIYNAKKIKLFKKYVFLHLSLLSSFIGAVLIIICILFGEKILILLYGLKYADYSDILILISISVSINVLSWNFDTALMAMRYISIQMKITIFTTIITVILGYFLIMYFGIYGATYILIINALIQLVLRIYFVNKKLNQTSECT